MFEKNPYLEVKQPQQNGNAHQNGSIPPEAKDDHQVKAVPTNKPGEYSKGPLSKLDPRYNGQPKSTLERQEEKAREEKAREEKAKEEKAKEEKAREEKAREEKLKEEKAKEEREKPKGREERVMQERGRSKTDEEVRIRADPRVQSVTPPPYIVKGSTGGILTST